MGEDCIICHLELQLGQLGGNIFGKIFAKSIALLALG